MPRQWVETEFCIDPATALLHSWSAAPGIYVNYDYSDAIQFHGRTLARQITVVEGNKPVLQIHIDSLKDADNLDPRIFEPTREMTRRWTGVRTGLPATIPDARGTAGKFHGADDSAGDRARHVEQCGRPGAEAEASAGHEPRARPGCGGVGGTFAVPRHGVQQEVFINVQEHVAQ